MTNTATPGPLDRLATVHLDVEQRITAAKHDRWDAIHAARAAGASWSEIGHALGVSKQAAQQWYAAAPAYHGLADRLRGRPSRPTLD